LCDGDGGRTTEGQAIGRGEIKYMYIAETSWLRRRVIVAQYRLYAVQVSLVLCLLGGQAALAQPCVIDRSPYILLADTVDWSMKIASGRSCISGVRLANVEIESVEVVAPPSSGQVTMHGPGFSYTAKANFDGQDSFTLVVFGAIKKKRGSSTINVLVSI